MIQTRCRRCGKEREFPRPDDPKVSEIDWDAVVLSRNPTDVEYARRLYQTQPYSVINQLFACVCGGPLKVTLSK